MSHTPLRFAHRGSHFLGMRDVKVIAFGGGHGLAANLRALRHLTNDLTAVVTVADNGGSSGRLRAEMPILPPGDLRMALSALCEDSEWGTTWRDVVQHRFESDGEMRGHALGNLLIVALWQLLDDPIAALDYVGALLGVRGRVLPMALEPLDIEANVDFGDRESVIRGQAELATTDGRVSHVRLIPPVPTVPAEVLEAVREADWLIIGPGSWYTSVIPHLLAPQLREAIVESKARRCLTMNLSSGVHETVGLTCADLLDVVFDYAPELTFDAVIADPTALEDGGIALAERARAHGMRALLRQVSVGTGEALHDPLRLAAAYRDVFDGAFADLGKD